MATLNVASKNIARENIGPDILYMVQCPKGPLFIRHILYSDSTHLAYCHCAECKTISYSIKSVALYLQIDVNQGENTKLCNL